jgi:hypothetical protein
MPAEDRINNGSDPPNLGGNSNELVLKDLKNGVTLEQYHGDNDTVQNKKSANK